MENFTFNNDVLIEEGGHILPAIEIRAENETEALDILRGMDGSRAFNMLRDYWVD